MASYARTITNIVRFTDFFTEFDYATTLTPIIGSLGIVPIWVFEANADQVAVHESITNIQTHGVDKPMSLVESIQVHASSQLSFFLHLSRESVNTVADNGTLAERIVMTIIRAKSRSVTDNVLVTDWIIPKNRTILIVQFTDRLKVTETNHNPNIAVSVVERIAVHEILRAVDAVLSTGKNIVLLTFTEYGTANETILKALRGQDFLQNLVVGEMIVAIRQGKPPRTVLNYGGETLTTGDAIVHDSLRPFGTDGIVTEVIGARVDPKRILIDASGVNERIFHVVQRKAATAAGAGSQQTADGTINGEALNIFDGLVTPTNVTFTSNAYSITLRKPKFGDNDEYGVFRVQQESRGRELIIYEDSIWPTTETLRFEFEYLTQSVSQSLITFLGETTGQKITYHDHLGRTWQGFIRNPDTAVEQTGKKNFTAKIEFQVIT